MWSITSGRSKIVAADRVGASCAPTLAPFLAGSQSDRMGSVVKIFKLIKNERVIAATTNSSRENKYTFYMFYLCLIVEYIPLCWA
jgi:hypothetical protein